MPKRTTISAYLQYLYFLRVSLLAWLFLPFLCALDGCRVSASLSRGILTLDSPSQWFFATFLVVATNMAVLVTARNTVRNGETRFSSTPPNRLYRYLTDSTPKTVWAVLAAVHLMTLFALVYLVGIGIHESEKIHPLSLFEGLLAALIFWYLVSLFYHWTYRPTVSAGDPDGTEYKPAALLFPNYDWMFGDIAEAEPPPRLISWSKRATRWMLSRVSCSGYAETTDGPLWELHFLSTLSLVGILIFYLFLYPLTSPVLRSRLASYGEIAFCVAVTFVFLRAIAGTSHRSAVTGESSKWGKPVKWTFITLALLSAAVFIAALLFDRSKGSVRLDLAFPTLGSILILLGLILWLSSGAAFFLDRYRLPLVTTALVFIFLPKIVGAPISGYLLSNGSSILAEVFDSDHYFSVRPLGCPARGEDVMTPAQTLTLRVKNPGEPYIVVTASGGGIRAAEWTAQVLAGLEKAFAGDNRLQGYTFHDHILLASGVSGGSVGLMPFLLEYTAYNKVHPEQPVPIFPVDNPELFDRITRPPGCSSLEGVGWGLAYHDFYRLIMPLRFPSALDDDDAPDRSWALAAAFNRNLHDRHCKTDSDSLRGKTGPTLPTIRDGQGFTLLDSAGKLSQGTMPAFTFNTTAAETGSRFLLSNYRVPTEGLCGSDFTPAESFLQAYSADEVDCKKHESKPLRYADLPLATAARLSATFPIVSSGTRIPLAYTPHAYHFLDGGYFDNDGTASAIEFFKSALDRMATDTSHIPTNVLWIEIRDDDGNTVSTNQDDLWAQNLRNDDGTLRAPPWTPLGQLVGIMGGLWNAGHVSISRRNRRELCVFEKAYHDYIKDLHHVVFTIPDGGDKLSPLSWNLTTGQQASITERINETNTKKINGSTWSEEIIGWVAKARDPNHQLQDEVCQVVVEQ